MGARPAWALLALTLPRADEAGCRSLPRASARWRASTGVALVGGDTTQRPLCVTVQLLGLVPLGAALKRCGRHRRGRAVRHRHARGCGRRPGARAGAPRAPADGARAVPARALPHAQPARRPRASACAATRAPASTSPTVCSATAGKLARRAAWRCSIDFESLPLSEALRASVGDEAARRLALSGGDDYELCFAVPSARCRNSLAELPPERWGYARIGQLQAGAGAQRPARRDCDGVLAFAVISISPEAGLARRHGWPGGTPPRTGTREGYITVGYRGETVS